MEIRSGSFSVLKFKRCHLLHQFNMIRVIPIVGCTPCLIVEVHVYKLVYNISKSIELPILTHPNFLLIYKE